MEGGYVVWKQVSRYNLGCSIVSKQFYLYYTFQGEGPSYQKFVLPQEFVALANMLRDEGR